MGNIDNRIAAPRASFGRAGQGQQAKRQVKKQSPQPIAPTLPQQPELPAQVAMVRSLDVRGIIGRCFSLMRQNTVTFLALVAAAAVPERIVYHLFGPDDLTETMMLVLQLLTAMACVLLYAAVFEGAMRTIRGEVVTFGGCLRAAVRTPFSAMAVVAMTILSVWFLLIVPGIALATGWAVAAPAAIVEGQDARAALGRSRSLTAPYRARISFLILLLAGLAISRAFTMLPVWGMPLEGLAIFMFGNWLLPLLLTAFTAAAGAVLYQTLVTDTDGAAIASDPAF